MKKQFKPIYGSLEKLTEQERADYVARACDFLDIPNDLNLIDLIWLDSGDGARNLLLYLKRGGTDLIRGKRGINITSLDPMHGDGFVAFAATGKDSSGRQEMAIGSASTKGLTGQAVATSLMLAQTRALRRLTLQFVGGGFLDESEVTGEKTSNLANAAAPLSAIAQPTVAPNAEAGKDITQVSLATPQSVPVETQSKSEPLNSAVGAISFVGGSPSVEEPRKPRRGRPRKVVSLDVLQTPSEALQAQLEPLPEYKPFEKTVMQLAQELVQAHPEISTPSVVITTVEEEDYKAGSRSNTSPTPEKSFEGTRCTDEQKKEYRAKLSKYNNEILPAAGFLQSEKSGSRLSKMKMFMTALIPGVVTSSPSAEDWATLFEYLDEKMESIGDKELVKLIDKTIGETNA